jgi:putative nucleotidyltransferase with HDIG domain
MRSNLDKLVILLSSGIAQRRLYFADHPKIRGCGQGFTKLLKEVLSESRQDELFIGMVDGKLVYSGRYLVGPSIAGRQLVDLVQKLQGGGLSFGPHTTTEEVQALLGLAAELKGPTQNLEEARELLRAQGIVNIEIAAHYSDPAGLAPEEDQTTWQGKQSGSDYLQSPILVYQALFEVVTTSHGNAACDRTLDIDGARSVSEHLLHSTRASFTDIMQLVHYPDYDSYTVGHSVRVATLAVYVGDHLGLDDEQLLELGTAGLLHDVGKSKIPEEILFKPGRLDKDEFRVMKSHARLGAEILLEHRNSTPMDVAAAWGHHIRHDGGGYPEKPPWAVRTKVTALLQVCDVFEALTAIRPYKQPMIPQAAYGIMLKDEGAFDPALLTAFVSAMGLYPPGNHVRLSDGSQGTVVAAGSDFEKPQVRLTRDAAGSPLDENDQRIIDLADSVEDLAVTELMLEPEDPVPSVT